VIAAGEGILLGLSKQEVKGLREKNRQKEKKVGGEKCRGIKTLKEWRW